METSYLRQIKTKTPATVVICVWTVLVSVVVQLSHAQSAEMAGATTTTTTTTTTMTTAYGRFSSLEKEVGPILNGITGGTGNAASGLTMQRECDFQVLFSDSDHTPAIWNPKWWWNYCILKGFHSQIVERLIKEWAPIVWLAPEEKFMPLGVEEFLRNVHAVDKGNAEARVKGMPLGDISKKAYLVTNGDIDELLEDDNSFLYGKNPNQHHVPIYAVVRLCSSPREQTTTTVKPPPPPAPPTPPPLRRGPYIPVSMNESGETSNTIRRSSRLYPAFARSRRNTPTYYNQNGTVLNKSENTAIPQPQNPAPATDAEPSLSSEKEVSEFIANLADNVKFTGDSGMNNNINDDYIEPQKKKQKIPGFHVTFWMFYPYSQGKTMCTLSLGPLGSIPFPAVYGYCLGNRKDIGSHVGDWEHMSLYFDGTNAHPDSMYVSAHDAGAYYSYNHLTGSFEFKKQETRKGILQRPNFPKTVTTFTNHPVLFAAKGSHGLWTAPGKHRFVKVARLYDVNGFGTPWHTWKAVDVSYENLRTARSFVPNWLYFKGKWGNPKSKCHPLRRIGLNFCEFTDGPTGIPLKEPHFQCDASNVL